LLFIIHYLTGCGGYLKDDGMITSNPPKTADSISAA